MQTEFGNEHQAPVPAGRTAWDANKIDVMFNIKDELAAEIDGRAKRAAKRQARLIAQAGGK